MNRNQKIALGCGGAGCLGLIVVAVAAAALYFYYREQPPTTNRNSNFNLNTTTNPGSNSNTSNDSADETSPSSSLSDDDQHKLFHAASAANDIAVFQRVMRKLGLFSADDSPTDAYSDFVTAHVGWLLRNSDFARTVDTPEKARAYVDEHLDD
jgi:hypothetical protein